MKKLFYTLLSGGLALPALVAAQGQIPTFESKTLGDGSTKDALLKLLTNIANIIAAVVLGIAVIMILISAFNFITAGGDNEKIGTARRTLVYALVGVAVAFLAFTLPTLVGRFVGGQ